MLVLGVDPGMTGGVVMVGGDGALHARCRMPVIQMAGKKHVDARKLVEWLDLLGNVPDRVVVEQVASMPKQGVASTFTFGAAYGAVLAVTMSFYPQVAVTLVRPNEWKKGMQLLKQPKQASLDACRMRFGDDPYWEVKANEGVAEAALIASWWIEKHMARAI